MNIDDLYDAFLSAEGISTDTRTIQPGNMYFALKGENFDGNRFTAKAVQAGACVAVIDNPHYEGPNTFLVEDTLEALQELARFHRSRLKIPVIGLTGSNGKTTTKELIAAVLSKKYKVAFTRGNLNNHIGVPLTLLSINPDHEMAVVEMGANHQKEIEFLCSICRPDFGYITNFGKAHLEGFGGIEGVIKGKSELYDFLRQNRGKAFINLDDARQMEKSAGIEPITFGQNHNADFPVYSKEQKDLEHVTVQFEGNEITSNLTGIYNFSNIAAAIAIGRYFKVNEKDIIVAITNYIPTNNRSQIEETGRNKLVVDTYNANPSSMEAALKNFDQIPAKAKWAILGDMFELGKYAHDEHLFIAQEALNKGFEKVILVGKEFEALHTKANSFKTTDEALQFLEKEKPDNKLILIKGSRGMKLERLIPLL